jgi:hypothetical protein
VAAVGDVVTAREWILKCFAAGVSASKRREQRRVDKIREHPMGNHVKNRKTGALKLKPWPPPKPIGCSPKKIFGDDKARPAGLGIVMLEKELAALRAEGVLAFTSGVWWKR